MTEHFQAFVARALRSISSQLHASSLLDQVPDEVQSSVINSLGSIPSAKEYLLDTMMAETVAGGSLIFPDPGNDSEPDWCVLPLYAIDGIRNARIFRLSGRLVGSANADEFVEHAYRLILLRSLDDEGRAIYPSLIETHQLSKRDVIRILMESFEAQSMSTQFLIIPQPSSWLSSLGITAHDNAAFPPLIVKADA